jgi:hypothetical protein
MSIFKRSIRFNALLITGFFLVSSCYWVFPHKADARKTLGKTRSSVHRVGNKGGNRKGNKNINVNKNVNVNVNNRHNNKYRHHNRHNNVGVAIAAGAVTGIVVGSIVAASALPPSCVTTNINGINYRQCGNSWYQPQYSGTQVNYIVVNPPR